MNRSDNMEARQIFSNNFGEFLDKKKAFDYRRPSKQSTLTVTNQNNATFKNKVRSKVSSLECSTFAGTTEKSTFLPFAGMDKKDLNIKDPIKVLHLTQPEERLSKMLFS